MEKLNFSKKKSKVFTSFEPSGGGPRQVVRQDMTVLEESSISELGSNGSYVLKVVKCSGQLGPVSDPMNKKPKSTEYIYIRTVSS